MPSIKSLKIKRHTCPFYTLQVPFDPMYHLGLTFTDGTTSVSNIAIGTPLQGIIIPGDRILSINNTIISHASEISSALASFNANNEEESVSLRFKRYVSTDSLPHCPGTHPIGLHQNPVLPAFVLNPNQSSDDIYHLLKMSMASSNMFRFKERRRNFIIYY